MKKVLLKTLLAVFIILSVRVVNAQNAYSKTAGSQTSSWKLTGNSGTNPATNFLGTTDVKALSFRTNNIERMRINKGGGVTIDSSGNVVGFSTGGLLTLGSSSNYNLGIDAQQIQARYNGAWSDLYINKFGGTTYVGDAQNSDVGLAVNGGTFGLLAHGVYGVEATGQMGVVGIGSTSVFTTYGGLFLNSSNVAVYGQDDGSGIGVEGYSAKNYGVYGTTRNSNSYAGYFAGNVFTTGSYTTSDEKLKQNIHDASSAMDIINQLHPKLYNYRQDGNYKQMNMPQGQHYGLIAQDVEKVLPNLVKNSTFDVLKQVSVKIPDSTSDIRNQKPEFTKTIMEKSGETINFKALNYTELIPIIIKGMQEQQQRIQNLQNKNDQLQQQLNELKQMIISNSNSSDIKSSAGGSNAYLLQNAPNPFNQATTIHCYIPTFAKQSQLAVYSLSGKLIKTFSLNCGANDVVISAHTLSSGQYSYSLLVDGRKVDTKSMMITK